MTAQDRSGFVLILTLFLMSTATVLVTGLYMILRSEFMIASNHLDTTRARYVARAGVEDALYSLSQDPFWTTGFTDKAFFSDRYTVTVDDSGSPTIVLTSVGYAVRDEGEINRSIEIEAVVEYPQPPPNQPPYPLIILNVKHQ